MTRTIKTRKPSDLLSKKNTMKSSVNLLGSSYTAKIEKMKLEFLKPFPGQPRKKFDQESINDLAESIKHYGVRQPITIVPSDKDDDYYIVSGERRWRASKLAGLDRIPCILLEDKFDYDEVAIIENLHREDLNPIELGESFLNLLDKGLTQEELANKLSLSRTKVTEYAQFAKKISSKVKNRINENDLFQIRNLRKISNEKNTDKQNEIIDEILGLKKRHNNTNKPIIKFDFKTGNVKADLQAIKKLDSKIKSELKNSLKEILKEL